MDQHFVKLQEINISTAQAYKVYGEFQYYVRQEPQLGLKCMEKAKALLAHPGAEALLHRDLL